MQPFFFDFAGLCCIMTIMILQEQSEAALQFKRKQIAIAVFLLLFVFTITGFLLYFAYDLMKGGNSRENLMMGNSSIKTSILNSSPVLAQKQPIDGSYFIYGEFSEQDKKYRLYKTRYEESTKENIFSLSWNDAVSLPSFAVYGNRIAVFPSINNGFFIDHNGHPANADEFMPPSRYFTVSPDGGKMFYFKYLSSLGNTVLVLRDLRKNQDIHSWPLNSPASKICEFTGWSPDGISAYCSREDGSSAKLTAFNSKNYSYSTVASVDGTTSAKHYPKYSVFIGAVKNNIVVYNTNAKEVKNIVSMSENTMIKNVFLAGAEPKIFYTAAADYGDKIYSANIDGSDQKELASGKNYSLISISANAPKMLFESVDEKDRAARHYFIGDSDGKNISELYTVGAEVSGSQFIGWFADDIIK